MKRPVPFLATLVLLASLTLGIAIPTTGAAAEEPCPNEAIREEQHSTYLDECRAYEQVTPTGKNSADVLANPQRTRAALDGGAVQYSSLTGFGDVKGGSYAIDYIARRHPDGTWSTHAITPAQEPTSYAPDIAAGFEPRYVGEFSSDLSHGVFMAKTPLTDASNVDHQINLYLRDNLLTPGGGDYQLLTDAFQNLGDVYQPGEPRLQPTVAGASGDFHHVIFESPEALLPEAVGLDPGEPKLYEQTDETQRLVGMVPPPGAEDCGGSAPACLPSISQAGRGAETRHAYTSETISEDGGKVIFTAPDETSSPRGQLYLRDDRGTATLADDTTVHLNASQRAVSDEIQSATFWAASTDATKVFFTTQEKLTEEDPNSSSDLYRYDLNATAGSRLTRVSIDTEPADNLDEDLANGHIVEGAIGASADGDTVYFVVADSAPAASQLIAGGSTESPIGNVGAPGDARIYRWRLGVLQEVGGINGGASLEVATNLGTQGWGPSPEWGRVTPNGRFMTFITQGTDQLLSRYGRPEYDHGNTCDLSTSTSPACLEVYVYSAQGNGGTGDLRCASCTPTGVAGDANAEFNVHFALGASGDTSHLNHPLSDDGRFVFFSSDDDLLEEDTNATTDAYAYNTETEQLSLLSSGTSNSRSIFLDASADGKDAFILTRSQLVGKDKDQSADLYDVRLNGGHPEPLAAAPCDPLAPDSCPASPGSSPAPATSPPTGAAGPGNPARHRRHKRHRKHRREAKRQRSAHRNQSGSR